MMKVYNIPSGKQYQTIAQIVLIMVGKTLCALCQNKKYKQYEQYRYLPTKKSSTSAIHPSQSMKFNKFTAQLVVKTHKNQLKNIKCTIKK
jgi:hypothetical protein